MAQCCLYHQPFISVNIQDYPLFTYIRSKVNKTIYIYIIKIG